VVAVQTMTKYVSTKNVSTCEYVASGDGTARNWSWLTPKSDLGVTNNKDVTCIGLNTSSIPDSLRYALWWKVMSETYATRVDPVPYVKLLRTFFYQIKSDGLFGDANTESQTQQANDKMHKTFIGALQYDTCCHT
jgi:hypothetical protein